MSDKQKEYLIDQVFKVGGVFIETETWFRYTYSFLRSKYRSVDATSFDNVFRQFNVNLYLDKLKKLYASIFTENELKTILDFWVSPAGHKLSSNDFTRQMNIDWAAQVEQSLQKFVKEEQPNVQEIQTGVKE